MIFKTVVFTMYIKILSTDFLIGVCGEKSYLGIGIAPGWTNLQRVSLAGNTWGESNSPRFSNFWVRQFMQFYFFWSYSLFFFLSMYFWAFQPALGMQLNRKNRNKNETEKYIITWTSVLRNSKILGLFDLILHWFESRLLPGIRRYLVKTVPTCHYSIDGHEATHSEGTRHFL